MQATETNFHTTSDMLRQGLEGERAPILAPVSAAHFPCLQLPVASMPTLEDASTLSYPHIASMSSSASSHHLPCPHLYQASCSGWYHHAWVVILLVKRWVHKPRPWHLTRLGPWVLRNVSSLPGQGRSLFSWKRLPMPYNHGAACISLLVVTCK